MIVTSESYIWIFESELNKFYKIKSTHNNYTTMQHTPSDIQRAKDTAKRLFKRLTFNANEMGPY